MKKWLIFPYFYKEISISKLTINIFYFAVKYGDEVDRKHHGKRRKRSNSDDDDGSTDGERTLELG